MAVGKVEPVQLMEIKEKKIALCTVTAGSGRAGRRA